MPQVKIAIKSQSPVGGQASRGQLRVAIVQRVLPDYRRPFLEALADTADMRIAVAAGLPLEREAISTADELREVHLIELQNRYFSTPGGLFCWQRDVARKISAVAPDVLVLEANPRILSQRFLITNAKQQGTTVLGWGLGVRDKPQRWPFRNIRQFMYRRLFENLDGFIAYGSKGAQEYSDLVRKPGLVAVAHNAVDTNEVTHWIKKLGEDKGWVPKWRASIGLEPERPVVLSVGRLTETKRIDLLLKASTSKSNPVQVLIVGDGPARSELEAQGTRLATRATFLGHQKGEVLARAFLASDVFVLPGSGGLALHQAMSYGLPVVASRGDGTEHDLVRGENGVIFEGSNPETLYRAIERILKDPDRLREMGLASRAIIENEMSLETMVSAYREAILKAASSAHTLGSQ